ncbi:hypothetical protein B0H17DRAFT_1133095 [Mycena rosella]|uniref:Uncharacterized protein n=1 Tax=Mycena rosella TaxID=1033263 RepID=A0AAD7GKW1_MYCRO|nr:hypothetical protein B0H17DRAFT_1133095 [Mycena rosella]
MGNWSRQKLPGARKMTRGGKPHAHPKNLRGCTESGEEGATRRPLHNPVPRRLQPEGSPAPELNNLKLTQARMLIIDPETGIFLKDMPPSDPRASQPATRPGSDSRLPNSRPQTPPRSPCGAEGGISIRPVHPSAFFDPANFDEPASSKPARELSDAEFFRLEHVPCCLKCVFFAVWAVQILSAWAKARAEPVTTPAPAHIDIDIEPPPQPTRAHFEPEPTLNATSNLLESYAARDPPRLNQCRINILHVTIPIMS